ncbi:unnamed protein product [Rotaria sordida]|uniref:G-protein coupled receptors family 1 profile domain-containing protein n=1 Tax=Rotaria sordida TaxID=392033 RepID=A0A815LRT8_9BILA|nr:unnamed protein product [Rotaria sordida]CAF1412299.1 unnamed protein product [Rotaria sordida]CAF1480835.1 unnamed protein product [Rotaria sordida]CAF1606130.1 unnamed protein product [Rotaria sordida]CAF3990113.1 unnamed protein product [Rotaria sordida]
MSSILKAAIQLSFWVPIVLFIIGIPSAILNAIIFIGVKTFRQSPSSYYIVAQSLFDFGALSILLLKSIPSISMSTTSISCKLTFFFSQVVVSCALSFLGLATFDRWAYTSRSARIRRLSSNRIAHCIISIIVIFWSLVNIPFLIFSDLIPPSFTCGFTNSLFQQIANFFIGPILCGIFPLIVLIIFGILTYQNFHAMTTNAHQQSVRTRLSMWEQQITRMLIIQTVLNVSCTLPRCILVIYSMAAVQQGAIRNLDQIYIILLLDQLTQFVLCLDFASSFYIFFLSSSRFRQTIKMHLKRFLKLGNNQVNPMNISAPTIPVTDSVPNTKLLTFCLNLHQFIATSQNYPLSVIVRDKYKLNIIFYDDLFKDKFSKLRSLTLSNITVETMYSIIFETIAKLYESLRRLNLLDEISTEDKRGEDNNIQKMCDDDNYIISAPTLCFYSLITDLLPCLPKLKNLIINSIYFTDYYDRRQYAASSTTIKNLILPLNLKMIKVWIDNADGDDEEENKNLTRNFFVNNNLSKTTIIKIFNIEYEKDF